MLPPKRLNSEDLWAVVDGKRSISLMEIAACLDEMSHRFKKICIDLVVRCVLYERAEDAKSQDSQAQATKQVLRLVK